MTGISRAADHRGRVVVRQPLALVLEDRSALHDRFARARVDRDDGIVHTPDRTPRRPDR